MVEFCAGVDSQNESLVTVNKRLTANRSDLTLQGGPNHTTRAPCRGHMAIVHEFTTDNLNYGRTLPRVNPQHDTASNSVVGGFRSFSPALIPRQKKLA